MNKFFYAIFLLAFNCQLTFGQKFDHESAAYSELGTLSLASSDRVAGVSEATGGVSMQFPLFTLNQDGFTLPISLSYQSNGFKVDAPASRCGLGWSLSAGGSITKVVCGLPDETPSKGNLNGGDSCSFNLAYRWGYVTNLPWQYRR